MKKLSIIGISLFFLCLFAYLLLINFIYPIQADDFKFIFLQHKSFTQVLTTAFITTKNIYFTWSGRIFIYFLHYVTLASLTFFNIFNAAIYCAFIYAIFLNIKMRHPQKIFDIFTLLIIISTLWIFVMGFAEAVLWKTGTAYLWTITATLFFIYPFLQLLKNNDILSGHPIKVALITAAAFILGTGTENLSVAVCLFLFFTCFIYGYQNRKLPASIAIITIGYILGTAVLITAPGNYVRAAVINSRAHYDNSIFLKLQPFSHAVLHHFSKKNFALLPLSILAIITLVVIVILYFSKQKIQKKGFIAFLFLAFIATFALIGAPGIFINGRTIFYSDVLFIIAMLSIISQLDSVKHWRAVYGCFSLIVLIILLPNFRSNYQDLKSIQTQLKERDELIRLFHNNENESAIVQAIYIPSLKTNTYAKSQIYSSHLIFWDIPHDSKNWITDNFKFYYGFKTVTLRPYVEVWNNLANTVDLTQASNKFITLVKNQTVFYITTQGSCDSLTNKPKFFLNIYPKNLRDISKNQRQKGFDNVIFGLEPEHRVTVLSEQAKEKKDVCVLAMTLPNYPIQKIETGQYVSEQPK